jgi:FAD dependent oxidoreductase TIGR03364
MSSRADLVVVGGGIVGLGHAVAAVRRGLSVTLIEREDRPLGASVRNFGHGSVAAQRGTAALHGRVAREEWVRLGAEAGFWVGGTGTVVVARHDDELAVLAELAAESGEEVRLLAAAETERRSTAVGAVGGAFLADDLRVDPRTATPAVARWLADQPGVDLRWSTSALDVEPGLVRTARGEVRADQVVVCTGHDLTQLHPDLAERHEVRRCRLHMLRVAPPGGRVVEPAVLTGWSLLRYAAFTAQPSATAVRTRLAENRPDLLDLGVNLMLTQRPDGDLLIGDTHDYGASIAPFSDETVDDLILSETAALLGVPRLQVRERWHGIYASAPGDFLVEQPARGVTAVAVTSGIGMTTGLGLAAHVVGDLAAGRVPTAEPAGPRSA